MRLPEARLRSASSKQRWDTSEKLRRGARQPGLGSYTIDAINAQDFAIVRSMVFVGSALYIIGLILTDISYTVADPRIRFS